MQVRSLVLAGLQGCAAAALAQDGAPWSITGSYDEDAARTVLGQDHRPRQQAFAVRYRSDADDTALARHQYRILDLPSVGAEPADTNGHVHRTTFGWIREESQWRLQIAGVVAVSSNALKHPDDLRGSDLRPDVAIERAVTDALWLGVRADDRFGRTLVYPGATWQINVTPAQLVRVGVPESSWRWSWTRQLESVVAIGPDGSTWHVRNRELTRRSEVRARSWLAGWALCWQPVEAAAVEVRIGRRFSGRLHYLLRDGSEARIEVPDTNVFGASATLRF